jgi:ligand-binding sensor domain-containing protein
VNNTVSVLWWNKRPLLFLFLIPFFSLGQWDVYNTSNSPLESNNIRCLALDTSDYVWIGTDNGLYAFDGNNWQVFNSGNSGFPSNNIRSIYKDGDSLIWVGTFDAGVYKYDGSWVVFSTSNSGIADDFVKDITRMPDGGLYFATAGGLSCFQSGSWLNYDEFNSSLWSSNISSLSAWASDTLYAGSINGGLNKLTDTIYPYNSYTSNLLDNSILDVDIDDNYKVWGATPSGGLVMFNPQNSFFSSYQMSNSGSPSNSYNGIFIGGLDSIYLSSIDAGLVTFINNSFTSVNMSNSNLPENYTSCVVKSNDKVFVGTNASGLAVTEGFVNTLPESSFSYTVITHDLGITINGGSHDTFYLIGIDGKVLNIKKGREVFFSSLNLPPSVYIIKSAMGFTQKLVID